MKTAFSITYAERLESYYEIVKYTMPGFFVRWVLFMIVGLTSGALLIEYGLRIGIFGNGYWYVFLGSINALMFIMITYRNIDLKRSYSMQIKDKEEWKYEIELSETAIITKTEKSESKYEKEDISILLAMKKYILIKTKYGNSIVLPIEKIGIEFTTKTKELINIKEMPNN